MAAGCVVLVLFVWLLELVPAGVQSRHSGVYFHELIGTHPHQLAQPKIVGRGPVWFSPPQPRQPRVNCQEGLATQPHHVSHCGATGAAGVSTGPLPEHPRHSGVYRQERVGTQPHQLAHTLPAVPDPVPPVFPIVSAEHCRHSGVYCHELIGTHLQ